MPNRRDRLRRLLDTPGGVWRGWFLTRAVMVALCFVGMKVAPFTTMIGDVGLYAKYHNLIASGQLPYRDFGYEYPPGTVPLLTLPWHLQVPAPAYLLLWVGFMLILDGATTGALLRLGRRWGSLTGAWLWLVSGLALGGLSLVRNDLLAIAPAAWAIAALEVDAVGVCAALLVVGASGKLWPALLLPFVALARRDRWRQLLAGVGVTTAVVLVPLAITGTLRHAVTYLVRFHSSGRGLEIESVPATVVLVWHTVVGTMPGIGGDVTSIDVTGPAADLATTLSSAATLLTAAFVLAVGLLSGNRAYRQGTDPSATAQAATTVLAASLVPLLVVTKVLSAQYLTWLIAVVALTACAGAVSRRVMVSVVAAAALTFAVFPVLFLDLSLAEPDAALVSLVLRNALLVALAVWSLRRIRTLAKDLPTSREAGAWDEV